MEKVTHRKGPANGGSPRVEDLIFLDDLRALGVPWIDKLIGPGSSAEDAERVWTMIRMWGPDHEDVGDLLDLSVQTPELEHTIQKILDMLRICESYGS